EQHRARGVGHVGRMTPSTGQAPQQKTVDRAKGNLARPGTPIEPGYIVEQPTDLRRREIRIDNQSGACPDNFGEARRTPTLAQSRRPAILPHDRIVHWTAASALPQDSRFPLVGDADRRNWTVRACDRFAASRHDALPDLLG